MERKTVIGGGALFFAGALIARETFVWIYNRFLDYLRDESGKVNWADFPWANVLGILLMVVGTCVLLLPFFRKWRQGSPTMPYSSELQDSIASLRMEFDGANIANRIYALESSHKAVIQDYQAVSGRHAQLDDSFDKFKEVIQAEFEKLRGNISQAGKIGVTAQTSAVIYRDDIRRSLRAIFDRERLFELASDIELGASALYERVRKKGRHDAESWKEWMETHAAWNANLETWIDFASPYMSQVGLAVSVIKDNEYDENWGVEEGQVPTADDYRKFKRHRIINQHWTDVVPQVMHTVLRVAFEGAPEHGIDNGQ